MPRECIHIPLTSAPAPEGGATFLSSIVYPDPVDGSRREQFHLAVCRWAIRERAKLERSWADSFQQLKPNVIAQDDKFYAKELKRGMRLLQKRWSCSLFVEPHLGARPKPIGSYQPTVENVAM